MNFKIFLLKRKNFFYVRISKNKNTFAKGCMPNLSEEIFGISKTKNTVEHFMKKNCKRLIKKNSVLEKY